MLAFSEERGLFSVLIFDAIALDALGCLHPAQDYAALSDHGAISSSTCGVHGLLLTCPPTERRAGVLRVDSLDPGSELDCKAMRCQQQQAHKPVSSPDAAFVCVCENYGAKIKIYDTQSGRLVLDSCVHMSEGLEGLP